MTKARVLIAEELSPATVEALGPDFEIVECDGADRAALLPAIADVDAILVRSATQVDAEAIAAAKNLKVIARAGVGLDNVDIKAATQAGVMVVNAPTSNIVSAAELAVALLLASARNVVPASSALANGEWKRSKYTGVEVADKVVGIVGLGRIGVLVVSVISVLLALDPESSVLALVAFAWAFIHSSDMGGIVAGSNPASELAESNAKLEPMRWALGG